MNREEQVRILIDYLKKENTGYASLADPVDYTGEKKTSKKSYECPLAGRGRSGVYQDPG